MIEEKKARNCEVWYIQFLHSPFCMTVDLEAKRVEEMHELERELDTLLDKEGGGLFMSVEEIQRLGELRRILERHRSELGLLF